MAFRSRHTRRRCYRAKTSLSGELRRPRPIHRSDCRATVARAIETSLAFFSLPGKAFGVRLHTIQGRADVPSRQAKPLIINNLMPRHGGKFPTGGEGTSSIIPQMRAPIRLEREAPVAKQAVYATMIGVFLTVLGAAGLLLAMRIEAQSAGRTDWLVYVVAGSFSLVGLMMVIVGFKTFLSSRLPETIVEVDRMPIRAGQSFQVTVRQPGPLRLESLRLNLVGEQRTRREVWRNGRRRTNTDRRLIHQINVLDLRDLTIARDEEAARQAEATVPAHVNLADIDGQKTVVWRLEVWGRVRGWVNFGHPFVIDVSGAVSDRNPPIH